jgi:hypothetical protein
MRGVGRWNIHNKGVVSRINLKNISTTRHEISPFLKVYIRIIWFNPWKNTPIKSSSKWYVVLLLLCVSTITWWQFMMCLFADTEIHWHKYSTDNAAVFYISLKCPDMIRNWGRRRSDRRIQADKNYFIQCIERRRSLAHSWNN